MRGGDHEWSLWCLTTKSLRILPVGLNVSVLVREYQVAYIVTNRCEQDRQDLPPGESDLNGSNPRQEVIIL